MAKRFTETNKWADKWFRGLSPLHKLAWGYLCDNCDAAGVIELDEALANFQIGSDVSWGELGDLAGSRIERLDSGKMYLTKFIEFQYGHLSEACPPHKHAIASLRKHGLTKVLARYSIPSGNAQEEDKDKKKIEEGESEGKQPARRFSKPTLAQVEAYCAERDKGVDASKWFAYYESNGWRVGRNPMRDWKAAVRTWEGNGFNAQPRAGPATQTARQKQRDAAMERLSNGNRS